MDDRRAFEIGSFKVAPGARKTVDLPVSVLSDHTPVKMSVHVIHGRRPGPVVFVSAAVHGDEVIGVEIARRVLRAPNLDTIKGTLLIIPIVNAFGFHSHSRYLPDRRDLNRSFPGSEKGSLAGRLANLFMTEIVCKADLGIDLHSAAIHRTNLPQIRVSPSKDDTMALAEAFGAPVILTSKLREGSLREAGQKKGVDILIYEAGEGLRFDEMAIRAGVSGILRVLRKLGMISGKGVTRPKVASIHTSSSSWVRAHPHVKHRDLLRERRHSPHNGVRANRVRACHLRKLSRPGRPDAAWTLCGPLERRLSERRSTGTNACGSHCRW